MSLRDTPTGTTAIGQSVAKSIDQIAHTAEDAVHNARDRLAPAAVRLASQAEDMAHRGVTAVREGSDRLRERAVITTERGMQYVKDEPVKAVLIAAAAGALLMAVLGSRSRRYDR